MFQFNDETEVVLRSLGIDPDLVSDDIMAKLKALAIDVASQIRRGEVKDDALDPNVRRLIDLLTAASKSSH